MRNKLLLFIVLVGLISMVACSSNGSSSSSSSASKITKEAFENLKSGMSYEEATEIIGFEGEIMSESGVEGGTGIDIHIVMYMYEGKGSIGANANLIFQENKLINKTQVGLK